MSRVFITGASGFIAKHIVKLFISKGYHVIGAVRSAEKGERLVTHLGSNFEYVIVPDMATPGAFDEALQKHTNIKYLLHTASPLFYDTTDAEADLIIPAINGTKNILNAAHTYRPEIRKIIITSSDAAIYSSVDEQNSALSFDETSWNNISYEEALKDPIAAYYGAKSFAEKLAWEFVKNNKTSFSLTAVNPGYVFGPQAFDSDVGPVLNESNEIINSLIKLGPEDEFVNDKASFIDVRDVALAHLKAVEDDNLIGKRLFLSNGHFSTQMIVDVLNEKFPQLKGKIPKGSPGSGPSDILTLAASNNDKTRELLGFEFIDFEKIIVDTMEQVLKVRKLSPSL